MTSHKGKEKVEDKDEDDLAKNYMKDIVSQMKRLKPSKEGGFAEIYFLKNENLAVKKVSKDYIDQYKAELETFTTLKRHQNIIRLWGSFEEGNYSYLFLELCPISLKDALDGNMEKEKKEKKKKKKEKKEKKELKWEDVNQIAIGIAKGLDHMHDACIAHCDIKPGNIMLAKDDNAKITHADVKIIDFGASNTFLTKVKIGTDPYCLEGERTQASSQRDIFALGTILIHLLLGNSEVEIWRKQGTITIQEHARGIKDSDLAQRRFVNKNNRTEIEELGKLAKDCVKEEPRSRPSIKEVLAVLVKKPA